MSENENQSTDKAEVSEQGDLAPSRKARALSARLRAVQAVYQKQQNNKPMKELINEYIIHRKSMVIDGEELVEPNERLLKSILSGVEERLPELIPIIEANLTSKKEVEPLLKAILVCAVYELMVQKTDAPIVINDYLNVAHAFYEKSEVGLINGILDSISKLFKDD
tara:strand:+ start:6592 stop:7089 length:498 start_codon:yes stop_codon:yes gene_type:complete